MQRESPQQRQELDNGAVLGALAMISTMRTNWACGVYDRVTALEVAGNRMARWGQVNLCGQLPAHTRRTLGIKNRMTRRHKRLFFSTALRRAGHAASITKRLRLWQRFVQVCSWELAGRIRTFGLSGVAKADPRTSGLFQTTRD